MTRWVMFCCALSLLLAGACAPASTPTASPTKAAPAPAATATNPAPGSPKPTAPQATTLTAAPKAAVKPLDPPVSVKIGSAGSLVEAFLYIADAKGYFADEGLKTEFVNFRSAPEMIAPMTTGELDAGGGSPSAAVFNAMVRGIPIKIVADRNTSFPGGAAMAVMVRKDLIDSGAVKDYSDLKGKTVAISAVGSITEISLQKALEKGGLKESDVNIVTIAFPDMVAAFSSKAIDAAVMTDPSNARAVEQGTAVRWKGEDVIYPNHEDSVFLYGPSFLEKQPEAAKRFMVAYLRGIRDYLDAFNKKLNRDQIVSILTKTTEAKEPTLYDKMPVMGVNPDGYVDPQSISADQDWYFAKGLTQQKVDLSKVIDNQYVDYAIQRLGKYQP